jgi:transcriptional regulator with XRE-family HTH domain
MDMPALKADALLMAKKVSAPSDSPRLYVGEWIRASDTTPAEVSREAPINEGYLSGIISGNKKNPSGSKLALIARVLGITVPALYSPPPSAKLLDQVADYDPEVVIRLSQKRKSSSS